MRFLPFIVSLPKPNMKENKVNKSQILLFSSNLLKAKSWVTFNKTKASYC